MTYSNKPSAPQDHARAELELITTWEFARVLRTSGFSHAEFANHIDMSRSYVTGVANGQRPVTFKQVQQLEQFLGPRLYYACLKKVRQEHAEARKRQAQAAAEYSVLEIARKEAEKRRNAEVRDQRATELEKELLEEHMPAESDPDSDMAVR